MGKGLLQSARAGSRSAHPASKAPGCRLCQTPSHHMLKRWIATPDQSTRRLHDSGEVDRLDHLEGGRTVVRQMPPG